MKTPFKPTHELTVISENGREIVPVQFDGRVAITSPEWESNAKAAWNYLGRSGWGVHNPPGVWLRNGQIVSGATVTIVAIDRPKTPDTIARPMPDGSTRVTRGSSSLPAFVVDAVKLGRHSSLLSAYDGKAGVAGNLNDEQTHVVLYLQTSQEADAAAAALTKAGANTKIWTHEAWRTQEQQTEE